VVERFEIIVGEVAPSLVSGRIHFIYYSVCTY